MSYVEMDSHSNPKCFKIRPSTGRFGRYKYMDKKTMKVIAKMRRKKPGLTFSRFKYNKNVWHCFKKNHKKQLRNKLPPPLFFH